VNISDFLSFCQNEYDAKLKIREDQVEGRYLRLEEKKVILERIENPPVQVPTKPERKGKQQKKAGAPGAKRPEPEQETEQLPYLPTPDEIILQREGTRISIFPIYEHAYFDASRILFNLIIQIFLFFYVKGRTK